jgi:hypothetical protein
MLNLAREISRKPRVAGTPQCDRVRDILASRLESMGYPVRLQRIPFTGWELTEKPRLKINGRAVKVLPVIRSGSTRGVIRGTLKETSRIKTFEAYEWIRYRIADKSKTKGYVLTRPDQAWLQLVDRESRLPYFMVYPDTYRKIKDREVSVEASVKSRPIKNQRIYNIITRNSSNGIVVCAHYDSIMDSPGANDNASGVSALMEVARTNREAQYILFSAEEWNKHGSYSYVRSLKKQQLKEIRLLINIDMIGSGRPFCICSKGLEKRMRKLLPRKVEIIPQPRPQCDFWPFHKRGVEIVHFGSSPYKYCHDPRDTIDKLRLKPMREIVGYINKIITEFH